MFRYPLFIISAFLVSASYTQTFIPISINSGNPAYPFPQFLPYTNSSGTLDNLATHNGVGVTHAEMEQVIRDAYRIAMNRCSYTGASLNGVKYIKFKSSPDCSEGDGYGLLCAAAMADKPTFDGMWLWIHDNALNKVVSYSTGNPAPAYNYSQLPGWQNVTGTNSATDGDVDIALALYTAYKQWGDLMGVNDIKGNPISYKQDCVNFLKGLTDTLINPTNGNYMCGDIGLDGYVKGGDSWGELTDWASDKTRSGFPRIPEAKGPQQEYVDYSAPAYFHEFADFLKSQDPSLYAWNINQFQRSEASSDWIMGQLLPNPKMIPSAGHVDLSPANVATFSQMNEGEDFRLAWRTILNFVWHGNPASTWDPASHQVTATKSNTFEHDIGQRYGKFLWDTRQSPWLNPCVKNANPTFTYWGTQMTLNHYTVLGAPAGTFFLNWVPGTGSISAVVSQDHDLMAELWRKCEIEWDVDTPGDGYLTSVPHYFHEWFRLLGLLVLSGNYQPPSAFKPTANMKVYLSIDKTFAFQKDTVTYTLDYRNYGSLDAAGVTIVNRLDPDFAFVQGSASGGGTFNPVSRAVSWNIGTVPGFKTATGIPPTIGQVKFKVVVANASKTQYRDTAAISCTNGTGWTSNEYPNHITAVMERNYLDIARRALVDTIKASRKQIKPGELDTFTIAYENTSTAGWINGGRPGVHFSFSETAPGGVSTMNTMRARIFHDAQEAYIDFGNYRISYFLYDSVNKCLQGTAGCATGWGRQITIVEPDTLKSSLKVVHELITPGQDAFGKWNQRLILQFSDPTDPNRKPCLATVDHQLSEYRGMQGRIHRGGTAPLRIVWFYNSSSWQPVTWNDDWSWDAKADQADGGMYFPVTNDWTDLDRPNIPVNTWNPKACTTATHMVNNILVEEWDGYTWRRVAGNGPMPGRDAYHVTIRDTIPAGFSFVSWLGTPPANIQRSGNVISLAIDTFQIQKKGTISYVVRADGSCPSSIYLATVNRAWISADKESPFYDSAVVVVACTTATAVKQRFIKLSPDSITEYTGNRRLVNITLVDSTGKVVTGEDILLSLTSSDAQLRVFADATASTPITSIMLVNGQAAVAVEGDAPLVGTVTVNPSGALPANTVYTSAILRVTIISKPSWPYIVSAKMVDPLGNMVPGRVDVTLSDTFSANSSLVSVQVTYKGAVYPIPPASITRIGTSLQLAMPAGLPADPTPSGTLALTISVAGENKIESGVITDGIGPQILSATLFEKSDPTKTMLHLVFSEPVQAAQLTGQTLQGIVAGTTDTLTFTVDSLGIRAGNDVFAVRAASGSVRFKVGDRVRLMPGPGGVRDMAGTTPHPNNPFVIISPGPSAPVRAVYFDGNADGYVDSVRITFQRPVATSLVVTSFDWSDIHADSVTGARLAYWRGDSSTVVALVDGAWTRREIKTSKPMFATILYTSFPDEKQSIAVQDSAAPVLMQATYCPAAAPAQDTLVVCFSEPVSYYATASPLEFLSNAAALPYALSLSFLAMGQTSDTVKFLVQNAAGTVKVGEGDSVWMTPGAFGDLADAAVKQVNPANRRVPLHIKASASPVTITLSANPFSPALRGPLTIRVAYTSSVSFLSDLQASAVIYDALGNRVFETGPFIREPQGNGVIGSWPGANRGGRMVGTGSYLAVIQVRNGNGLDLVKRMLVGIKR